MKQNTIMNNHLGGWALIVAGIIFAVGLLFHPDEGASNFSFDSTWAYVHIAIGIAFILALYGMIAYLYRVMDDMPQVGQVAILVLIGAYSILSGLILFVEGIVFPALGNDSSYMSALAETGPLMGGTFSTAFMAVLIIYSLASITAGYYIATSRTVGSWGGWLLLAAPLIAFAPPLSHTLFLLGGVIVGIGYLVIGMELKKSA